MVGETCALGTEDQAAAAITYAAENGARVINNSWIFGDGVAHQPLEDAVRAAHGSHGAVVVFAAGNGVNGIGVDMTKFSPQNQAEAMTVAASTRSDGRALFSNFGALLALGAPGVDMLSTRTTTGVAASDFLDDCTQIIGVPYCHADGTSMAAAHVAGAAALLLAARPTFTNEDVRQALRVSAAPSAAADMLLQNLGSPESGISAVTSGAPLIFVTGPTCSGTTCQVRENASGTFDPVMVFVTAIDLDGSLSSLQTLAYPSKSTGSTFTTTRLDDSTIQGTFTWANTAPGIPISFSSLDSCNTAYNVTFFANDSAGKQVKKPVTLTLVKAPIAHPPVAIASTRGFVNYGGSLYQFGGYVSPNQSFELLGYQSCDPDGSAPQYYKWTYLGNAPNPPAVDPALFPTRENMISTTYTAPSLSQETNLNFRLEVAADSNPASPRDFADTSIHVEIDGICFIATAAYGSSMAPELDVLRAYRDAVLMRSSLGRSAVQFYYRMSPPVARFIANKPWLRGLVRWALGPIVRMAKQQVEPQ